MAAGGGGGSPASRQLGTAVQKRECEEKKERRTNVAQGL